MSSAVRNLPVAKLGELVAAGAEGHQLVDVREPWEHAAANIAHFQLLPMNQTPIWARTLDPALPTVVLCHAGVRSRAVAEYLTAELGFTEVYNVTGGIDAYSRLVDKSVPLY